MFPLLAAGDKLDANSHVLPHSVLGSPWFTNHHLMSVVVLLVGLPLLILFAKSLNTDTTGKGSAESFVTHGAFAQFFETLCVFIRDEVTRPLLGDLTDKYIKYIWSTFFFILFANLLGMIPIGAILGYVLGSVEATHMWGTLTGNLNFTGGLGVIAFFAMIGIGLKENGMGFVKHMWPVPVTPPEGVAGPMLILVMPILWAAGVLVFLLEVAGFFIKAFALSVRLFANMVAGHLVLGSLIIMAVTSGFLGKGASVLGAAAFSCLELFVAFLQAYIFTFLVVIFISLGAVSHDDHDEHAAGLDEGEMPGEAAGQGLSGTQSVGAH